MEKNDQRVTFVLVIQVSLFLSGATTDDPTLLVVFKPSIPGVPEVYRDVDRDRND